VYRLELSRMKWINSASTPMKPVRATITRRGSNINQMRCIPELLMKEWVPFGHAGWTSGGTPRPR
jgi:hypothetical protein